VNSLAHCEIPTTDPVAVRGARNLPCPNSAQRGPLPESCGLTFRRGMWPETGGTVTYDLGVGTSDKTHELDIENRKGEDLWKILVLAPLSVR
jgi:phospholipid/cholesterol/gamma-HCH transport system substrate-binding protein